MKINLNKEVLNLDGESMYEVNASEVLARYMINASTVRPTQVVKLGIQLKEKGEVEVTDQELDLILSIIEHSDFPNITKYRMMEMIGTV